MRDTSHRHMFWVIGCNIAILVLGAVMLAISIGLVVRPSISVRVPKGGEHWELGSTHAIAWSTENISAADKIAVTIRRIPPPPLQEEGQEFDPVIVTDLTNTGHFMWTISDSYPAGTYVLGFHAYAGTPVTKEVSTESREFEIFPRSLPQDLYPLYDRVDWKIPQKEYVTIGTTSYAGTSIFSLPATGSSDPASIFSRFERYYADKLASRGWRVDNAFAAGGHVGGQTGYRKGDELVLVRFNIRYHTVTETAPSACPCDVTVSLFSAKVKE